MPLEDSPFGAGERSWFIHDAVWYPDLPDVVEAAGHQNRLAAIGRSADGLRKHGRVLGDSLQMADQVRVTDLRGEGESIHRLASCHRHE
jgi:hypothetical protein